MKYTLSFKLLSLLTNIKLNIKLRKKNWIFYLSACHLHSANIYVYTFHKFHTFFYSPNNYHYHFSTTFFYQFFYIPNQNHCHLSTTLRLPSLLCQFFHALNHYHPSISTSNLSSIDRPFKISSKKQLKQRVLRGSYLEVDPLFTAIGHDLSMIAWILSRTRVLSS